MVVHIQKKDLVPLVSPEYYLTTTLHLFPYKNKTLRNAVMIMLKTLHVAPTQTEIELVLENLTARRVRTLTPLEIADLAKKFHDLHWL